MHPIEAEFLDRAQRPGGILLLKPKDALEMVLVAKRQQVAILGIDAVCFTEHGTQPKSEHDLNLSGTVESTESWRLAEEFLRERLDSEMYFEVVLE